MSRIHEALRKAEQERALQEGTAQEEVAEQGVMQSGFPAPPTESAASTEREPIKTVAEMPAAPVPITAAVASLANPSSLDALACCRKLAWKPDKETMLFFNGDDNARGTEEYRTLRSRLYHIREKTPLKKILVTSALPKEGKSFTAANLAQVLVRQHGRRALLIDADLRGPKLHTMLGTTASPGLSDYLQGKGDEFSIMQSGPMENLSFIPSGEQITDPAEMVANGRLKLLLQRVESLFDWIIIDSPPAVPVSDAGILAKSCDGVLMVVRSNATPVDMARRAREEFPGQALIGVVLNGTDRASIHYSRYYYQA